MQPDSVEVVFCELCGASVPQADLDRGAAARIRGKTVGACCTAELRGPGAAAGGRAGGEGRMLPVAVAVLAAVAAGTLFLDQKVAAIDQRQAQQHDTVVQAMRADSEVLQAIDAALDGAARRADLDAVLERLQAAAGEQQQAGQQQQQRLDQLDKALQALQAEQQRLAAAAIDYRPLFDELRAQAQRHAEALAALRSAAPAAPPPAEAAAPREPAVPAAPPADAGGLPPALQPQLARLGSADPAVRFEAVDELLRSKLPAVLPHLLPLGRDADAFVRRLVLEGLRDFKHADAVEALLLGLGDADPNVADTAWRSLKDLTGQKLPFDATAGKDARARAQQRWQEWWDKNKAGFGS